MSSSRGSLESLTRFFFGMCQENDTCKLWPASLVKDGRPVISNHNSTLYPQTLVYSWYYKKQLDYSKVYFSCGNELCINPRHMCDEFESQESDYDRTEYNYSEAARNTFDLLREFKRGFPRIRRHAMVGNRIKAMELDSGECVYCGMHYQLVVDHVIPFIQGGSDHIDNLVMACQWCNGKKNGRTPDEAGMKLRYGRFRPLVIEV